ncbi:MAG: RsmE family RNA methyltransferase [Myxococcales bacterium]|nr:RsmE family RNA methyltransferase [Myxococcales bacterium]
MSPRVFACGPHATPPALVPGGRLVLDRDESHYLRRVRRVRVGATVEVIDGAGALWSATLADDDARACALELGERLPTITPPRVVDLVLCMPESAATLTALTGASEAGAHSITLARSARSSTSPPSAARQLRVLRAAQRQCGRPLPPEVHGPMSLTDAVRAHAVNGQGFFAWAAPAVRAQSERPNVIGPRVWLVVGPEGGLVEEEVNVLREVGATAIGLGPWVLRSETAAIAGIALLLNV